MPKPCVICGREPDCAVPKGWIQFSCYGDGGHTWFAAPPCLTLAGAEEQWNTLTREIREGVERGSWKRCSELPPVDPRHPDSRWSANVLVEWVYGDGSILIESGAYDYEGRGWSATCLDYYAVPTARRWLAIPAPPKDYEKEATDEGQG
jgi:hypothetical protein